MPGVFLRGYIDLFCQGTGNIRGCRSYCRWLLINEFPPLLVHLEHFQRGSAYFDDHRDEQEDQINNQRESELMGRVLERSTRNVVDPDLEWESRMSVARLES